ncbi:protein cereblon homolog [Nesidiocoris tenuis]|nr:protein cereblon homolog [Nesidiocoris tenuis]
MSDENGNGSDEEMAVAEIVGGGGDDDDDERLSPFEMLYFGEDMRQDPAAAGEDGENQVALDEANGEVFDEDLPVAHSYMGEMEEISGRTVLPDGAVVTIPLLPCYPGSWVPGTTFPLVVHDEFRCQFFRTAARQGDHIFGTRARHYLHEGMTPAGGQLYGTTCEIYEFTSNRDHVAVKAKVRQRFKQLGVKKVENQIEYAICQILPEYTMKNPLANYQLPSLDCVRHKKTRQCQMREACTSRWPIWVHRQYDTDYLRDKVYKELQFLQRGLRKSKERASMPRDPSDLSFWLGAHLGADERLFLIQENSPIRRLRWILSLMKQCRAYYCLSCDLLIGHQEDFFAMSAEGAQSTYVNPGGFVHDTVTLLKASHLSLISHPSAEFSWFPGYYWQIAVCTHCHKHIGWKFTSQTLVPRYFWGLSRQSLVTRVAWSGSSSQETSPVM